MNGLIQYAPPPSSVQLGVWVCIDLLYSYYICLSSQYVDDWLYVYLVSGIYMYLCTFIWFGFKQLVNYFVITRIEGFRDVLWIYKIIIRHMCVYWVMCAMGIGTLESLCWSRINSYCSMLCITVLFYVICNYSYENRITKIDTIQREIFGHTGINTRMCCGNCGTMSVFEV